MYRTLGDLCGEHMRTAEEWQHWWNKNKRRDWDEKDSN